jgi:hypothetical protein
LGEVTRIVRLHDDGRRGLMVLGTARTTPLKSATSEWPAQLDGAAKLGSGKPVTPCPRTHCEICRAMSSWCAVGRHAMRAQ